MLLVLFATAALAAEPTHLSVDEALARLEAHNPSVQRADAAVQGADAASLAALSSVLPSLTGVGNYTRNNAEVTLDLGQLLDAIAAMTGQPASDGPGVITLQPLDAFTGTASLKVPIVSASSWASIGAAHHAEHAAEANAEAVRSTLRGQALQAFWMEAAAESLVVAQQASVERARALAESAERAVNAGTATRLSMLQAQTDLARRQGELLQGQASLEKARLAVGALLGEDGPVAVDLGAPNPAASADADALVNEAYQTRGEIAAANASLEAARANLLSTRLTLVPTLSAGFAAFASTEPYPTGENTGWKATADLSWPLIMGGARSASAAKASASVADAEAALNAAKLQVAQQVRNAVADQRVAAARLETATRQRSLAEEAARVAQRSFEEGLVDQATVLDALDRLDMARASEIDATARVGMAEAALSAAVGRW